MDSLLLSCKLAPQPLDRMAKETSFMEERQDLRRTEYEKLFELLRHYSELLFKGRLAIISAFGLFWAYFLGYFGSGQDATYTILTLSVTPRLTSAFVAALVTPMFASLENAYFRRFSAVGIAGRNVEAEAGTNGYFSNFYIPTVNPFLSVYLFNMLALLIAFVALLFHLNSISTATAIIAAISVIPTAYFVSTILAYARVARAHKASTLPMTPHLNPSKTPKGRSSGHSPARKG